jgi:histidinol-phosphate aminotransferase
MKFDRRDLLLRLGAAFAAGPFLNPARISAQIMQHTPGAKVTAHQGGAIHLDRNENAYGASEKALAAIQQSAEASSHYPDLSSLHNALASHHSQQRADPQSVGTDQIVVGCGSSDVLRMAAAAFLGPGKVLIQASPTCDLIGVFARNSGATVAEVPLRKDHAHDLAAMLEHAHRKHAAGLIYVCNPNSPTGTLTTRKDLEDFLSKIPPGFYVVLDEAYHHYAGGSGSYASFLDRPPENPGVIVTRTFSAAYGLAGARVGYGVAAPKIAAKMSERALPSAISTAGAAAALAALSDSQHLETCVKRNFDDRQEFMNQVNARMLRALDSHANFVCLNVMRPADEIFEHYRKNSFVVAPLIPSMPTYLRVSLGNHEEMREFWHVWDLLGSHPMSM